jgi:hypothetical protein
MGPSRASIHSWGHASRGIQLLSDGGGPLYRPWKPSELTDAAKRAHAAL